MRCALLLRTTLAAACLLSISSGAPVVDSPWGRVAGVDVSSPEGRGYHAYLGLPFALPPVGERRWTKPLPHPGPGAGVTFNASMLGHICPQPPVEVLPGFPSQDEDCLTLNVYVPSSPSTGRRSVMVWIYGGGFFVGSAAGYRPSRLVTEGDVIVVVIQYRIGLFGFMASGSNVLPGNWGLWDQHLAFTWVKENVAAFGGDPTTITLFGESAGAGSIGFHLLNGHSKDLFLRGIQQSGTPLAWWAIKRDPETYFRKLAARVGCAADTGSTWTGRLATWSQGREAEDERLLACLRQVGTEKLAVHNSWLEDNGDLDLFTSTPWMPVVDGDFVAGLPQDLIADAVHLEATGALTKDVMIGVNNNEGGYVQDFVIPLDKDAVDDGDKSNDVFTAFASFKALDEKMENALLTEELQYWYPELKNDTNRLAALREVLNFFYIKPIINGTVSVQGIANTFADVYFTTGAVWQARSFAKAKASLSGNAGARSGSLYLYLFDHYPAAKKGEALQGMNHAEDLAYQWDGSPIMPQDKFDDDDNKAMDNFITMLVDFAKNGNANSALGAQLGQAWPQFSLSGESYLALGARPRVDKQLYSKRVGLWLDLLPSLVKNTRPKHAAWNSPPRRDIWSFRFTGILKMFDN